MGLLLLSPVAIDLIRTLHATVLSASHFAKKAIADKNMVKLEGSYRVLNALEQMMEPIDQELQKHSKEISVETLSAAESLLEAHSLILDLVHDTIVKWKREGVPAHP